MNFNDLGHSQNTQGEAANQQLGMELGYQLTSLIPNS